MKRIWFSDAFIDNVQFVVFVGLALLLLCFAAMGLAKLHEPERRACVKAGYEWSATKYVCVVKPNK